MPTRNIVVIGASLGGIETLCEILQGFPPGLPAAVFVVQHTSPDSPNLLPGILARHTAMPVFLATDERPISMGEIVVAAADHHLLLETDRIRLSRGPRENRTRPAIDPLFRSATLAHGAGVVGIVLTGLLDDGTAGLQAIQYVGGLTVVQDPQTAIAPDMPRSALEHVNVDYCLAPEEIGSLLSRICGEPAEQPAVALEMLKREVAMQLPDDYKTADEAEDGELTELTCPECGGTMRELPGEFPRYRCHTGHVLTGRHMLAALTEQEGQSLWVAVRIMEERCRVLRRMAREVKEQDRVAMSKDLLSKAEEIETHIQQLRHLLEKY